MHLYNLKRSICNSLGINIDMVKWLRKQGAIIGEKCEIHQHVDFGSEPYLITIGEHVRITNGVKFFTHEGGLWVIREIYREYKDADEFGAIVIGDNVHIGVNAIIMPGVHIGSNCIIGAGAVVTHDIPDNSIVAGIPARVIRTVEEFYAKHEKWFVHSKHMSEKEKRQYITSHVQRKE